MSFVRRLIVLMVLFIQTIVLTAYGAILYDTGAMELEVAEALAFGLAGAGIILVFAVYRLSADLGVTVADKARVGPSGEMTRALIGTLFTAAFVYSVVTSPPTFSDGSLTEALTRIHWAFAVVTALDGFQPLLSRALSRRFGGRPPREVETAD